MTQYQTNLFLNESIDGFILLDIDRYNVYGYTDLCCIKILIFQLIPMIVKPIYIFPTTRVLIELRGGGGREIKIFNYGNVILYVCVIVLKNKNVKIIMTSDIGIIRILVYNMYPLKLTILTHESFTYVCFVQKIMLV